MAMLMLRKDPLLRKEREEGEPVRPQSTLWWDIASFAFIISCSMAALAAFGLLFMYCWKVFIQDQILLRAIAP